MTRLLMLYVFQIVAKFGKNYSVSLIEELKDITAFLIFFLKWLNTFWTDNIHWLVCHQCPCFHGYWTYVIFANVFSSNLKFETF